MTERDETRTSPAVAGSKAGTYDTLIGPGGVEVAVFIVEDGPTHMVARDVATGHLYRMAKFVQ